MFRVWADERVRKLGEAWLGLNTRLVGAGVEKTLRV